MNCGDGNSDFIPSANRPLAERCDLGWKRDVGYDRVEIRQRCEPEEPGASKLAAVDEEMFSLRHAQSLGEELRVVLVIGREPFDSRSDRGDESLVDAQFPQSLQGAFPKHGVQLAVVVSAKPDKHEALGEEAELLYDMDGIRKDGEVGQFKGLHASGQMQRGCGGVQEHYVAIFDQSHCKFGDDAFPGGLPADPCVEMGFKRLRSGVSSAFDDGYAAMDFLDEPSAGKLRNVPVDCRRGHVEALHQLLHRAVFPLLEVVQNFK